MSPRFRIAYKKGKPVNGETGYTWTITGEGLTVSGWSAGRKADAVAEAERRLDELVADKGALGDLARAVRDL